MQLFLSALAALVLVIILIRVLHASQLKTNRDIADQGMPLPPLAGDAAQEPRASRDAVTVAAGLTTAPREQVPWQDEVKALRDSGRFREALSLCRRQYPRMLAFRQTMITLRSQIKSGDEEPEQALREIYRTAILAGLAKTAAGPITADDITRKLPLLEDPQRYWHQLGYKHLDLLSKTDCSLLIKHWGEPGSHNDINQLLDRRQ